MSGRISNLVYNRILNSDFGRISGISREASFTNRSCGYCCSISRMRLANFNAQRELNDREGTLVEVPRSFIVIYKGPLERSSTIEIKDVFFSPSKIIFVYKVGHIVTGTVCSRTK